MTYKETEKEVLRLLGVPDENQGDRCFADYLGMISGSVIRALHDVEARKILPLRSIDIKREDCEKSGELVYILDEKDMVYSPYKLTFISGNDSERCLDFSFDNDEALVFPDLGDGIYRLSFYPRVPEVTVKSDALPVPEWIAAAIPYFVAGDIYMGDEPGLASLMRSKYEIALSRIDSEKNGRQRRVESKFRMC